MIASDGKAMSTKTPRTDESTLEAYCRFDQGGIYDAETRGQRDGRFVEADFARQLETELQEANAKCDKLAAELAEAVCGETEMDELVRLREALKHIAEYDEAPIWNDSRDDAANDMLGIARRAIGINDEEP